MAGFRIEGNTSGNVAEVDANNNIKVTLPTNSDQSGFVQLAGTLSGAADPAGLITEELRSSAQGRLSVGAPVLLMNEFFNNTTLNSAVFTAPVTTMTVTVASGTLNLNASAITTINTVARVSTYAHFPFQADFATYATWDMLLTQTPQTNTVIEAGFGIATASSAPTDGAFFRYDTTGTLKGVVNTNGSELMTAALTTPTTGVMHRYKVVVENDRVFFYINGICQGVIDTPNNLGFPLNAPAQPFFARIYNGGVAPSVANVVRLGYIYVGLQDAIGLGRDNATINALQGRMGSQGQTGQTMGSTALLTNSLAAGAGAAATNTTAALGSGLGGQFSVLPTLAAGTDGIISSYQNPLPTSAIPAKTLYIKGVRVQGVVTTVLAGGPVVYEYTLAYGHNAVSLATTESATGKAPRRVPIGIESFAATAAVGTVGSNAGQYMAFTAPIAVMPGEFVQVTAKNFGTVTTTGVITIIVTFDAYWE
jgi:hypothetical protein